MSIGNKIVVPTNHISKIYQECCKFIVECDKLIYDTSKKINFDICRNSNDITMLVYNTLSERYDVVRSFLIEDDNKQRDIINMLIFLEQDINNRNNDQYVYKLCDTKFDNYNNMFVASINDYSNSIINTDNKDIKIKTKDGIDNICDESNNINVYMTENMNKALTAITNANINACGDTDMLKDRLYTFIITNSLYDCELELIIKNGRLALCSKTDKNKYSLLDDFENCNVMDISKLIDKQNEQIKHVITNKEISKLISNLTHLCPLLNYAIDELLVNDKIITIKLVVDAETQTYMEYSTLINDDNLITIIRNISDNIYEVKDIYDVSISNVIESLKKIILDTGGF